MRGSERGAAFCAAAETKRQSDKINPGRNFIRDLRSKLKAPDSKLQPMTRLEKKLSAALRRLGIGAEDSIVAAVSGGADSTALLDALARLRRKEKRAAIVVAHLNHQLRGEESDGDEAFVARLAAELKLPIFIERIAVAERAREERRNLESTARQLRYDFLQRVAETSGASFVLTAHTRDDQAETVLMRLLRGAGAEGLRGIHAIRPLDRVKLARPLLEVSRAEVLAHCACHGLEFRTDSSNFSTDLMRNRIRHELLPGLREFNPRADEALLRAVESVAEDDDCLGQWAEKLLLSSLDAELQLNIGNLGEAHPALRRRVIRAWLRRARGGLQQIDASHIAAIDRLIVEGQSGQRIDLPGGWLVLREFDRLKSTRVSEMMLNQLTPVHFTENTAHAFGDYELKLLRRVSRQRSRGAVQPGADVAVIRESAAIDALIVRARIPGDAYVPAGSRRRIKLKTLMIRHGIPVSRRGIHPLIAAPDGRIVWSPGLPVAREFAAGPDEDGECALITARKPGAT
jgi:tRNA(Ile)-lysidine synthase